MPLVLCARTFSVTFLSSSPPSPNAHFVVLCLSFPPPPPLPPPPPHHPPSLNTHQNYWVDHINTLQAMVLVQHVSGQFNLYLSDTTGVDYSLSLRDVVVDFSNNNIDVELVG